MWNWRRLVAMVGLEAAGAVAAAGATPAQAVVVHFQYGSTDLSRLFELEKKLETAIGAGKVGEYDGNEMAVDGSDGFLYMYGPDADRLFDVVQPVLESATFMRGAKVTVRYGAPGPEVKRRELVIAP